MIFDVDYNHMDILIEFGYAQNTADCRMDCRGRMRDRGPWVPGSSSLCALLVAHAVAMAVAASS